MKKMRTMLIWLIHLVLPQLSFSWEASQKFNPKAICWPWDLPDVVVRAQNLIKARAKTSNYLPQAHAT
jgi:hypothetical protein